MVAFQGRRLCVGRGGFAGAGARVAAPRGILAGLDGPELFRRDTTSGREGLDLLPRLKEADASVPVVVMTAWANVELAVEAMRRGARDFVQKPWDNVRLLTIVRTQIEFCQALRKGNRLEAENEILRAQSRPNLIAQSPAMRPGPGIDRPGRPRRRQRAHHGRKRHRQRVDRRPPARRFKPSPENPGDGQYRRALGRGL